MMVRMAVSGLVMLAASAGGAFATSELLCIQTFENEPALCGVISPDTDDPRVFSGWVPVPSGLATYFLNSIEYRCIEEMKQWRSELLEGRDVLSHFTCNFEEVEG
jgi:hypothetical protein